MGKFKFQPYSFSKLDLFNQCPKKFEYVFIEKPPVEPPSRYHLERGDLAHLLIENVLQGTLNKFNRPNYKELNNEDIKEVYKFVLKFGKGEYFQDIKKSEARKSVEQYFSLNEDFRPAPSRSVLNGKIDFMLLKDDVAQIIDWKTGGKSVDNLKRWPKPNDQLEIYALWAIQKFKLKGVKVQFCFVEHNYVQECVIQANQVDDLREKFKNKILEIEQCNDWEKKIGPLCNYCDYQYLCEPYAA